MANNILVQVQINKSVMFIFISHTSLNVYLSKVGMVNKYSKHKEFIGYNLTKVILDYIYNFVDKVKVINIEYNVKLSSLDGMIVQKAAFHLSRDVILPINFYSFDKDNQLFLSLELTQYLNLPVFNRGKSGAIKFSNGQHNLSITLDPQTILITKQYRKEVFSLELEFLSGIHRIFIDTSSLVKVLSVFFGNIDEVINNNQLMSLILKQVIEQYLGVVEFIKIRNCKLQILHKYLRLNQFNVTVNNVRIKCFALGHDTKIVDKFNKSINSHNSNKKDIQQKQMLLNTDMKIQFPVIKHEVKLSPVQISRITVNTILLLSSTAIENTFYKIDLGEKELVCDIVNESSLKITGIN
jgi:hypothetical protein